MFCLRRESFSRGLPVCWATSYHQCDKHCAPVSSYVPCIYFCCVSIRFPASSCFPAIAKPLPKVVRLTLLPNAHAFTVPGARSELPLVTHWGLKCRTQRSKRKVWLAVCLLRSASASGVVSKNLSVLWISPTSLQKEVRRCQCSTR